MKRRPSALISVFFLSLWMIFLFAEENKSSLPDPVKYLNKFGNVWDAAQEVLKESELKIELVDRAKGRIVTKPYEFISGSMTVSELDKVSTYDGLNPAWLKGRYTIELIIELLQSNETSTVVRATIEGLKQELSGEKKWVERQSNGTIERRILGRLSMKLFAPNKQEKKGFWDHPPQPVLTPREAPRPIPSPTRDRP